MATFREIDERLLALIDPETGELLDVEAFEQLQMERTEKAEKMALWALDIALGQQVTRDEIKRLQGILAAMERKEKHLREYLGIILGGQKLRTPLITVSYRTAAAVEVDDEEAVRAFARSDDRYEDVLRYKEPEISKSEIKRLIAEGVEVPGARVVNRQSVVVK